MNNPKHNPKAPAAPGSECSNCGSHNKHWRPPLLHHVRLRDTDRLLCSSCVLRLHPSSFCPLCFLPMSPIPNSTPRNPTIPHSTISCSKCRLSHIHSHCLSSSSPYICPPCSNPNFSFTETNSSSSSSNVIDKRLASILLCAARISAASMNKAAVNARADAERKVREASVAKKRAREALEHLVSVEAKEKEKAMRNKEDIFMIKKSNGNVDNKENNTNQNKITTTTPTTTTRL